MQKCNRPDSKNTTREINSKSTAGSMNDFFMGSSDSEEETLDNTSDIKKVKKF